MKRFFTFLAAIVMVLTAMAQHSGIVLSYNKGKELKFYVAGQLSKAIEDAEVNDTIYFGTGEFRLDWLPSMGWGSVELTKPLVFIGSGAHSGGTSLYNVDALYLNIDPSLEKSKRTIIFEGLTLPPVIAASDLKELKFVNVEGSYADNVGDNEKISVIDNLIIDRSHLENLNLNNFSTKKININNSKIGYITGGCDGSDGVASLDHCAIDYIIDRFIGFIKYSLIYSTDTGQKTKMEDCWWYDNNGSADMIDCKQLSTYDIEDLDNNPSSLGKCNDGTVYGTLGGKTPYTLYPQYPTPDTSIDSSTGKPKSYVDYDALNKKLTITVKRLGE